MDTGKYKKIEEMKYAHDKPSDCRYCYWWFVAEERCILGEGQCYYILPKTTNRKKSECDDCPYGKASPCIGYCLRKIMNKDNGGQDSERTR